MKQQVRNTTISVRVSSILGVILLLCLGCVGQEKREPDRGFVAGGSYALSDVETINTTNGNLMLNIPLASLPGGRGPGFTFALRYNSKLWDSKGTRNTDVVNSETGEPEYFNLEEITTSESGGWNYSSNYQLEVVDRFALEPSPEVCNITGPDYDKQAYRWKVRLKFPDGSVHEFRPNGQTDIYGDGYFKMDPNGRTYTSPNCGSSTQTTTSGMTYHSTDGSFLRLVVDYVPGNEAGYSVANPWTLYFPDGGKVVRPAPASQSYVQRVYDRNGNYLSLGTANGIAEDQFGRVITIETDPSDSSKQYVKRKGVGGDDIAMTVKWKTIWVYRLYDSAPGTVYCYPWRHSQSLLKSLNVVDYIELPPEVGNLRYNFDYNGVGTQPTGSNYTSGWGELKEVELPSGAVADYSYWLDSYGGTLPGPSNLLLNSPTQKDLTYLSEYGGSSTPVTETWLYSISSSTSSITGPDGSVTQQWFPDTMAQSNLFGGMVYKQIDSDGTKVESIYQSNAPESNFYYSDVNAYVKTELTSIKDASGNYTLTAAKDFDYDKNGNVTEVREYDWMPYSSVPRSNDFPTGLPTNASSYLKRKTVTTFYNDTPTASSTTFGDTDSYHLATSPRLLNLVKSAEIQDAAGIPKSRSEVTYDYTTYSSNTLGGNPTQSRAWDSYKGGSARSYSNPLTSANSVTTSTTYNSYGMQLTATDANGNVTETTYGNVAGPNGNVTDLYPTQTVSAYGTGVARTSSAVYDFYTGLVTTATDVDNNVSTVTEHDSLGRPEKVRTAANTALESWTRTEYDDVNRRVIVRADIETIGDGQKVATQFYDQLGRVRLTKTLENATTQSATNETDGIKVETRYLTSNPYSYQLTSNPFRAATATQATSEPTMGWTRSKSWNTGKKQEVETFSGAGLPSPWSSNSNSTGVVATNLDANMTTVTDQAGRRRRNIVDAQGQLVRVDEPNDAGELGPAGTPNRPTFYFYDALGKMVRAQQGVQNRYFMYNSLGRLIRVRQPEQQVNTALNTVGNPENNNWTAGFTYDNNGNSRFSTDANNVTTTSAYDALDRQVSRAYSDSTPPVSFTYDAANVPHSKGKLTKISSQISETRYLGFDENGQPMATEQITDSQTYPSGYKYNLGGALTEQTYPSGRVVKNFLETNGDLASIASKVSNAAFKNYAANFDYMPSGVIKQLQLGNGLWENAQLNSRQQVTELTLGNSATDGSLWRLNYHYGEVDANGSVDTTKNTGNIARQTISVSGMSSPFVQTYRYDALWRITEAKETNNGNQTWLQTFGYDRYGNRTSLSHNIGGQQLQINNLTLPQVDPSTNRFQTGQGYSYDPAGNLIGDPQNREFVFNGDNRQIKAKSAGGVLIGDFHYDGEGKRVKKVTPNETVVFVYDAFGKLIAELSTTSPPQSPTVNYTATDLLGSPRVLTNSQGQIVSRRDFMPFGEEVGPDASYRTAALKYGAADNVRQKFTGYQRDNETGLDFAEARYYNSSHGRFTAVDPLLASGKSADPQTFNRYVYTMNQPLVLTDPSGLQAGTKAINAKLRRIIREEISGRWTMDGRQDLVLTVGSQNRIINVVLPFMRRQYEMSRQAQNALNAQENSRSNETSTVSQTTTTAPTTAELSGELTAGGAAQVGVEGVGVRGEAKSGGKITTTIIPGTSTTRSTARTPSTPQELDQAAEENIGNSNIPMTNAVESLSGLSGNRRYPVSIEGTAVTMVRSVENISIIDFAPTARTLLTNANNAGREQGRAENPITERKPQ